ncbi:histidine phosphatase family protein [Deinococcus sp.]|uniref:histidine phosphatase family protein n=1 Tax=Deinococcus sp. TaxID=47478 RepID=UPI0025BD5D9A|nr:histidine phosphatase family protein [Deinococcus sp.]
MTDPTRLILVRHGQTAHNKTRRVQGHIDEPLDELGREQAHKVARHFRQLGIRGPRLESSDLSRAYATAQAIQAETGGILETYPALREISMGEWEGQMYDELAVSDAELHEQFWSGDPSIRARGGESAQEVAERVYAHALAHWPRAGETVILVSHGIAIGALLTRLLEQDYQTQFRSGQFMHRNTGYSILEVDPLTREILNSQIGQTPHLD